jgi:copper transport protein
MKMCRRQQTDRQALQREGNMARGIHTFLGMCLGGGMWRRIALALCLGLLSGCGGTLAAKQPVQDTPRTSPTSQGIHPFHATVQTLDRVLTVTLTITPDRAGTNMFTVHVRASHSSTPPSAVSVTLYTTMQDMPMGTDAIHLHRDSSGSFSATGVLSMQGHWAIGIVIQTPDNRLHKGGVMLVTPV